MSVVQIRPRAPFSNLSPNVKAEQCACSRPSDVPFTEFDSTIPFGTIAPYISVSQSPALAPPNCGCWTSSFRKNRQVQRLEIPLKFRAAPSWPEGSDPPSLQYNPERYSPAGASKPQPVLAGRTILRPDLGLNRYTCNAEIDWVELRLCTLGHHQAQNIHRFAAKELDSIGSGSSVFVSGPGREPGYSGSEFILRLQQPKPNELAVLSKSLVAKYAPHLTPVAELPPAGVEISVDFRVEPDKHWTDDTRNLLRWQMTDILRRHLRPEPVLTEEGNCAPRFYVKKDGKDSARFCLDHKTALKSSKLVSNLTRFGVDVRHAATLHLNAHTPTPIDTTSYIGGRDFPVMIRVMDKRTDKRDPISDKVTDLPAQDWRSRIEVTLKAERNEVGGHGAVDLHVLSDLYGYKFRSIRKTFFEFFLPTVADLCPTRSLPFPVTAEETSVFERSGVYGLDRLHRAVEAIGNASRRRDRTKPKPSNLGKKGRLLSYAELNRKVDRALDALSKNWADSLSPGARSLQASRARLSP